MDLNQYRIANWRILRNYFGPPVNAREYTELSIPTQNNQLLKYLSDHAPIKMTGQNIFSWNVADLVNDYNRLSVNSSGINFAKFKAEYDSIID